MAQLFILAGFANWGKTFTLRRLFDRHTFFSTKRPILLPFTMKQVTIINMSNDDLRIEKYLEAFRNVHTIHRRRNHNFIVTLCPVLDGGDRDCHPFLQEVRGNFSIHLITLGHSWQGDRTINREISNQVCNLLGSNQQLCCNEVINHSQQPFNQRVARIQQYIDYNAN